MLNLRRSLLLAVTVAALAGLVPVSHGQEADADRARTSLRQGIAQFNALEFKAAKQTLLGVDRSALPEADRKTLDEYIDRVDPAIREQMAAMAAYRSAETALKDGELALAKEGFAAAAESEYMPAAMRLEAKAQLAVVEQKMAVVAEVAAALHEQPQQPAPEVEPVAEPELADDEPAEVHVPAVAEQEPPAPEPLLDEPPAEALAALEEAVTAADERAGKVEELIALGQKALDDNQPESAIAYFQRALALDPENAQALRLLSYSRQTTATVEDAGILSRLERNRRIARQGADVEYDKALVRAYELLARADSAAEFNGAVEAARVARNVLDTNRGLYTEGEYRERLLKVEDQIAMIETRREQWNQLHVRMQLEEIQQREAVRRQQEAERRQRRIADLKDRARVLRSEGKYGLALEVVQQVLNIDPSESWAADQVDILRQFVLLQEDKAAHQEQRYQEQQQLIDLRRAEIPWYELIKYPQDWKELSRRREPFGADVVGRDTQADRELRQLMKERLPGELFFEGTEFRDVVEFLRGMTNANIFVKWTALMMQGVDEATPVDVRLSNITFEKALRVILDYVGGVEPLSYVIDEGVITISTQADLATKKYTDVYDIRDLIVRVPNFAAPRIDIGAVGETVTGADSGTTSLFGQAGEVSDEENIPTRTEIILNIVSLIQETIDPLSWPPYSDVGSIRELHGQLVVTQTSENHQSLMDLIRKLREARALQVSSEARFIAVNTGFLNSIGLDLDFFFNTGSRLGSTSVVDPFTGAVVPTTGGVSGWGSGAPGSNKWTPMAVRQGSTSFTNMLGVSSPVGAGSIGSAISNSALSIGGTFLDDIQVDFLIQATQAHSSTRSLIAPRLTLFNGQRAYVAVMTQQAYVADLEPVVAENAVTFNPIPGRVGSGAILDVEATISADRRYVTLTVRPQVTNVIGFRNYAINQAEVDADGNPIVGEGFIELPTVSFQELETTVSVPDGGTLLLGGQRLSGETEREMGVPLLNKIPIINRAFSNRGMVRDEQTLLILIKPKIIIQREEEERQHPD